MTDDERAALSALLEGEASTYYTTAAATKRRIAAQLRIDGERIKALEAALKPFANSVYRDNGSILLQDVPTVGDRAWLAAYQAIYTPWVE